MGMNFENLSIWTYQYFFVLLFLIVCFVIGAFLSLKFNLWGFDQTQPKTKDYQKQKSDIFQPFGHLDNLYLKVFFHVSIGLAAVIFSMFLLGLFNGFQKSTVLTMLLFWLSLSAGGLLTDKNIKLSLNLSYLTSRSKSSRLLECSAVLVLLVSILLACTTVLGKWDDTSFHLPIAASYVREGGIFLNEYVRYPLFPQNINLLFVIALLFGDHLAAQAMANLPLFICCLGLLGVSVWLTRSTWVGFIAIFIFLTLDPTLDTLGYAYVDNAFGLFCWAAIIAVCIASQQKSLSWVVAAGLLAASALGSKYFALPLLGLFVLWFLYKKQWRFVFWFSFVVLLFGSAWYVRSFLISGDPIHPLGAKWFGYFLWNASDIQGQMGDIQRLGVGSNPWLFFHSLFHIKAGALILAFIPIVFFRKLNSCLKFFSVIWLGYFLFWFFLAQVERYIAPILALGGFLAGYSLYVGFLYINNYILLNFDKKSLFYKFFSKISAGFFGLTMSIISFYVVYQKAKNQVDSNLAILVSRSDAGYELYKYANTLKSKFGDRLLQINFEQGIYFFDGTVIGDGFGVARYSQFQTLENNDCVLVSAEKMKEAMMFFKARMLIFNKQRCAFPQKNEYPVFFKIEKETDQGVLLSLLSSK